MALALTCSMQTSSSVFFNDCMAQRNSRERALAWRLFSASFIGTGAESGLKVRSTKAQHFISRCQRRTIVMQRIQNLNEVEVLLVEDNPSDAELTMRALKKKNLANKLVHVKDGV